LRGGSWYASVTFYVRSSDRNNNAPGVTIGVIGFRVARAPL
jgi:formylglycine-generating enzyme required for sulfatase activity